MSSTHILPWTRSCFVCGENNPHGLHLRSRLEKNGRITLEHCARAADLGYSEIVHGGIAATLLDEVMTWAAIVATRHPCVAAEMVFRLKHPIKLGTRMRVTGRVTRNLRRMLLTEGSINDENDRILVTANGKYVPMPPEHAVLCKEDFVASVNAIDPRRLFAPTPGDNTAETGAIGHGE